MATWLIVPDDKLDDLEAINALQFVNGVATKVCTTADTMDGVHLTNADKIGDSYWGDYQDFLLSLEVFEGEPEFDIPAEGR